MQGQTLIEAASQVPPSDAAREDIHDDRQVHKLLKQPLDLVDRVTGGLVVNALRSEQVWPSNAGNCQDS